jgi:hypothetical protein
MPEIVINLQVLNSDEDYKLLNWEEFLHGCFITSIIDLNVSSDVNIVIIMPNVKRIMSVTIIFFIERRFSSEQN